MQSNLKILFFSFLTLLLVSCSNEESTDSEESKERQTVEFNLTANDKMKFNLKSMVVNEGDLVKVKLINIGKMPKATMGHNFVLLKQNVDIAVFATKALSARENDYIPENGLDDVIVHSRMLGPGEEELIEFTAPTKGRYKYICSFPGHYITMQGILIVR